MAQPLKNVIVYIIGFPGVGKKTIAQALCARNGFHLVDNHATSNLLIPLIRTDSRTPLPAGIWEKIRMIRQITCDALVEMGDRKRSYVFTGVHVQSDTAGRAWYEDIENTARRMGALFVPVRLLCSIGENARRITDPRREEDFKSRDITKPAGLAGEAVLHSGHPGELSLDVTRLSAAEAAAIIDGHIRRLYAGAKPAGPAAGPVPA